MTSQFYIIVGKDELKHLIKHDYIPFNHEDEADERMNNWMFVQMKEHLPSHLFETTEKKDDKVIGPHWLFTNKDDICWEILDQDNVVLEVSKNITDCLFFDDNDWVQVANNIMNNDCYTYLAHSQTEADENLNATKEQIKESWKRIFTTDPNIVDVLRDEDYCGEIWLRAITPFIHKSDVKKIIMAP